MLLPLTQADITSHGIIVEDLGRITPGWPVLLEESAEVPFDECKLWRCYWLIDLLGGTKEFVRRTGELTVNIALVEDGFLHREVVYAPSIDRLYYAAKNLGACRESDGRVSPIRVLAHENVKPRVVVSC